ncbi:MAG: undecaprenyl-diphosphate phosphatase, partial [Clostridia bacterium]|nr:undecaprenyl-diphosphate phosphatase [Clostridia bacterium]
FKSMFEVVIQLGSILAVLVIYFSRLNPWSKKKTKEENKYTMNMWGKIIVAVLPAAVIGLLFDDLLDKYLYNYIVVSITLIVYGIAFILIERSRKNKPCAIENAEQIDYKTALFIGMFQVLALIPGTSRSGSTIVGAMLLGVSRTAAAEFSFFLAIPVMLGASGLRGLKYVLDIVSGEVEMFGVNELSVLIVGTVVAFVVSLFVIKALVSFVRRHSFESFGWYRIALGAVLIALNFIL